MDVAIPSQGINGNLLYQAASLPGQKDSEVREMFAKLQEPFEPDDIEWRIQGTPRERNGAYRAMILPYITNRAVQQRLDDVFGPWNWQNTFVPGPMGGVMCGISVCVNGVWITKYDGADKTDVEAIKGGYSDAMKRAAVEWGIGRYLYRLPKYWATVEKITEKIFDIPDSQLPRLPEYALPKGFKYGAPATQPKAQSQVAKPSEQPKVAAPKVTETPAAAPKEEVKPVAASEDAKIERARGYKVPAGLPKAGQTLGQIWDNEKERLLAKRIIQILAGKTENMNLQQEFTPSSDDEKALRAAAMFVWEKYEIGLADKAK